MVRKHQDIVTLGEDLGGTKVKTAVVNTQGKILCSHKSHTHPEKGSDQIISDMITCINECQKKAGIKNLKIMKSELVENAGIIGAATITQQNLNNKSKISKTRK